MNLANLGLSGLAAATARLHTTGHNINNADTEGYNRQRVITSSAGGRDMGFGFIGQGVRTNSVERSYDNFLYRQLVGAQTTGAALVAYGNEITQVNNLFGDPTVGISPALQKFFDGIQAVASAPADPAARQELLGRAASMVGQINDANAFLDAQRQNINTQISTVVNQINSYVEQVRDLNHQIVVAKASSSGRPPNDLYDQREQIVSELSQLAGVRIFEQGDQFNITIGNGQVLLGGDSVFPLQAIPSASDPTRSVVAYSAPAGAGQVTLIELADSSIKGGNLGGLLQYRSESLDAVQNDLGRLAMGLAMEVNRVHQQGFDINGNPGVAFFEIGAPNVIKSVGNNSNAIGAATITDASMLTAQDYLVEFDGINYLVTSVPGGSVVTHTGNGSAGSPIEFDGVQFTLSNGAAQAGDSWLVQPTRHAAGNLSLALQSTSQIAAAGSDVGQANGDNALELAALQTAKILGNGSMSLNETYSQLVNKVAVQTQQNGTAAKAQATLIQQNYAAQQAVSGVNLNEEHVNLQRYQEQFMAASRLIDVSSTLFDTLLGLRS